MLRRPSALHLALGFLLSAGTGCGKDGDEPTESDTDAPLTEPALTDGGDDDPAPTEAGTDAGDATDTSDEDSPVWDTPYCFPVAGAMKWPEPLPSHETEVVALVNQARAAGGDCGSMGSFAPSAPLTMNASLHCAARVHSKDMADRMFFDHTNPDGQDPFDRMAEAGYGSFSTQGENIAMGTFTPADTVNGWLESDGHCANILNPAYEEIGVGVYEGGALYWTQTFAAKF